MGFWDALKSVQDTLLIGASVWPRSPGAARSCVRMCVCVCACTSAAVVVHVCTPGHGSGGVVARLGKPEP